MALGVSHPTAVSEARRDVRCSTGWCVGPSSPTPIEFVGEDVDYRGLHQGVQADCRTTVVAEDQKILIRTVECFEIAVLVFHLQWKVPLAKIAVETGFQVEGYQLFRRGLSRGCLLQSFLLSLVKLGSGSTIPAGLSGERRSRYRTIQFYLGHK